MGYAAEKLNEEEVGNGRKRRRRLNNANQRSFARRAIWITKDDGQRIPVELDFSEWSRKRAYFYLRGVQSGTIAADPWLKDIRTAEAGLPDDSPLISTTYKNPSTGTLTCYCLAFDLDYEKASDDFKSGGQLDWSKIFTVLEDHEPAIARRIGAAARSTSGRGIGVMIPISPIELNSVGGIGVEDIARKLQKRLIRIFNFYGFGADQDALGLERWMPNYCNPKKSIDMDFTVKSKTEKRRDRVIKELLIATDNHPAIAYVPKKSHVEDFIYHYAPVEEKLAKLYLFLLEEVGLDDYFQTSVSALSERLEISDKTLRKILRQGLCWLSIEHLGGREGYRLSIRPNILLTERARSLADGKSTKTAQDYKPMRRILVPPEQVQDGERYDWRGNVLLALKLKGIDQATAIRCLEILRQQVPEGNNSRTFTSNLKSGVKAYWTKKLYDKEGNKVFGSRPNLPIPPWLRSALNKAEVHRHKDGKHFYRKDPVGGLFTPPPPNLSYYDSWIGGCDVLAYG